MTLFKYETHASPWKLADVRQYQLKNWCVSINHLDLVGSASQTTFNGNTTVPHKLPWRERVELFCEGYEKAYDEGEKLG